MPERLRSSGVISIVEDSSPLGFRATEINWRFWVFLVLLGVSGYYFTVSPILNPVLGHLRYPTYTPVSWITPLPLLFRLTCYYKKASCRHLFTHPLQRARTEHKWRNYMGRRGFHIQ